MSVEKFQHFVPKMHLKRFADGVGKLYVWNKRAGKMLRQRPGATFAETHLYTTENEPGVKNTLFEKELSKLETIASIILDKIEASAINGKAPIFSEVEKSNLDRYIYTAWKRVPDFFGKAESIKAGSEFLDEIFERLSSSHPDAAAELDALDTPASRKRLLQSGKIQGLAVPSEKILGLFARRGLVILQPPAKDDGFIIGSLPVVRTKQSLTEHEGEVWLPISPRLAVGPGLTEGTVAFADLNATGLLQINRTIASQSTMFAGPNGQQITELSEWLKNVTNSDDGDR